MSNVSGSFSGRVVEGYRHLRQETYLLFAPNLGGSKGRLLDWGIMGLIAANVTAVILSTVAGLQSSFGAFFYWFEVFSVIIFSIEYAARLWSAVEDADYQGPISGRFRYAARPLLIVDFLAILPFYLSAIFFGADLRVLRALRLIRILRLFKLARYSESMRAFATVFKKKRPDLVIAMFANVILLVIASSAMYYIERGAQPDAFSSIPEAMWWGVATLTTVGYGDVHPITPLGQFVGAIVAVLGIGLFALPASILASGFIDAARDHDEPDYCPNCGERLNED